MAEYRDRIKELKRVKASELVRNVKNPRLHPEVQFRALEGVLKEVGWSTALVCQELPDGQYGIIDGHLRQDIGGDEEVPILVLDVTDEEADKLLVSFDPLSAMARTDEEKMITLLESIKPQDDDFADLLKQLASDSEPLEELQDDLADIMANPIRLTKEQREIVDQAIRAVRKINEDSESSEGRCVELIAADFLSGIDRNSLA